MILFSDEMLYSIEQRFASRLERVITSALSILGKRIKEVGQLSQTDAIVLANSMVIGADINKITEELAKATGKNIQDIYPLYDQIAKKNLEFAKVYYEYRDITYVPYYDNIVLQRQVQAWGDITAGNFINISKSTGWSIPSDYTGKKIWYNLADGYKNAIDQAVLSSGLGLESYNSAMYKVIKNYSDSGIKTIDYASGYAQRIDTAIRRNVLDGMRYVNQNMQQQIGAEIGADGVEISAHPYCAEDHLPYQGRQYTKTKYDEINNSLIRPIGTLNCKHFVFDIVLGVSSPSYTKDILQTFRKQSTDKITFKGETYTKYQATQLQRKIETAVRKQKDFQIISKESGNKQGTAKAQQNITMLTNEYKDLSKTAGIPTQMERMRVVGYKRVSTK